MHRVRTSLPYFATNGWDAEVVAVDPDFVDFSLDPLLTLSLPPDIVVHKVKAFRKSYTSKIGLGSLALRSLFFYLRFVNDLLKAKHYDLIYFSTTQFPVCILGAYWKRRFNIPYVIDMQDPWYSDYYETRPAAERPPKYWFSSRLNKYLEPIAIKKTDGLVSVSDDYISKLKERYPQVRTVPSAVITFGAFRPEMAIADAHAELFPDLLQPGFVNIVYIGRGGADLYSAISPVFESLRRGLTASPEFFGKFKFYFIGTSYAPPGQGSPTILPLARQFGVETSVVELTDRISYYHALVTLKKADALFIPGSDDPQYTASKLYPYLLAEKPILAIFNQFSSAIEIINQSSEGNIVVAIGKANEPGNPVVDETLRAWAAQRFNAVRLLPGFDAYGSEELTTRQTILFNEALDYFETQNTGA
jgi:hypothetical protein